MDFLLLSKAVGIKNLNEVRNILEPWATIDRVLSARRCECMQVVVRSYEILKIKDY
jgi:hypothetical protein